LATLDKQAYSPLPLVYPLFLDEVLCVPFHKLGWPITVWYSLQAFDKEENDSNIGSGGKSGHAPNPVWL